jgi:hypothetical protein
LLLFDTYEFLNSPKGGLESLNIYLTNLAGFYKLSWNYRLNKSNEVTLNFLDTYQGMRSYTDIKSKNTNKIEKFLSNVSEPFQLISIGLAKKTTNKKYLKYTEVVLIRKK